MAKLEDFFEEHRDEIDRNAPPEGHFERFEAKLDKAAGTGCTPLRMLWRVAAVIAITAGIGYFYFTGEGTAAQASQGLALRNISPEFAEVELFYVTQIELTQKQMEPAAGDNAIVVADIKKQLEQLEEEYNQLKLELEENYGDERVINAMIQNYRLRLQVIEKYLIQLKSNSQNKTKSDEDIEA